MIHHKAGVRQPTHAPKSIPITVNHRGRTITVGQVIDQTFSKRIQGSKHILRIPPGIAFDVSTLDAAEQAGAVNVAITDTESGRIYAAAIATIRQYGFTQDRGYGKQLVLPLPRWSIDGQESEAERKAAQAAAKAAAASYQQPGLFAEFERPSYMEAFK